MVVLWSYGAVWCGCGSGGSAEWDEGGRSAEWDEGGGGAGAEWDGGGPMS